LADQLGKDDIAGYHLQELLISEAEDKGAVERCARSLLVRSIHENVSECWHLEWDDSPLGSGFRRAGAYSSWCVALPERYQESYRAVWNSLVKLPIPEGWLPQGIDDPFIIEAFKNWKETAPE
jgi:hypothetical protein